MGLLAFFASALASLRREPEFGFCDGLRGLAVLWVCADHAVITWSFFVPGSSQVEALWWPVAIPSSGAAGVDVFLVLSGFLIGGSLHREVSRKGRVELGKFFVRRLFRIFPALLSALLLTMATDAARGAPPACPASEWWMNTFLFKNLRDDGLCMSHTWSVSLELQLYMLTPFFFMFASCLSKIVPGGRLTMSRCMVMLAALGWAACAARRLWYVFSADLEVFDVFLSLFFYMRTQFRFSTYAAGVLAGIVVAERKEKKASPGGPIATASLVLALAVVALTWFVGCDANAHENTLGVAWYRRTFPTVVKLHMGLFRPLLGAAVAGIIMLCAHGKAPRTARLLGSPLWRPLAGLSYSMYLLQFVGLYLLDMPFLRALAGAFDSSTPLWLVILSCYAGIALFILGAMAVALVNYILVEYPGMEAGRLLVAKLSRCGVLGGRAAQTDDQALGRSSQKPPVELDLEDANEDEASAATTRTPSQALALGEGWDSEAGGPWEPAREGEDQEACQTRLPSESARGGYCGVQQEMGGFRGQVV